MPDKNLIKNLKDPLRTIQSIRNGLAVDFIDAFLLQENFSIQEILDSLNISRSTYFKKKKTGLPLDSYSTEKFIRLFSIFNLATDILGDKTEAKNWLHKKIPSLNDQIPLDLLDTETGHRLVEQTLLQIKYGIYS